jgi:hypothetical protein
MDIIIQNINFLSAVQAITVLELGFILLTLLCLCFRLCNFFATLDEGKSKKPVKAPTDRRKVENEILDAVEEAWNECYYGKEFEERLDSIRRKYTESEDSGDERCS